MVVFDPLMLLGKLSDIIIRRERESYLMVENCLRLNIIDLQLKKFWVLFLSRALEVMRDSIFNLILNIID